MSQIKINYQGEYQIDEGTWCMNPIVNVTSCIDDMIETVNIEAVFRNLSYSYGRSAGFFNYEGDTWTNDDVILHLNTWMQARKVG